MSYKVSKFNKSEYIIVLGDFYFYDYYFLSITFKSNSVVDMYNIIYNLIFS